MTVYYYHATNKKNLAGIKANGLAPASKRPQGVANGATENDRTLKTQAKRDTQFKGLLKKLVRQYGYQSSAVLAKGGETTQIEFSRTDLDAIEEKPYVDGQPLGMPPARLGVMAASNELDAMLTNYAAELKRLGLTAPGDDKEFKKRYDGGEKKKIDDLDLTNYRGHFLYRLGSAYEDLLADAEAAITRERVYFFNEKYFASLYASYVKDICQGDFDQVAILRVEDTHVKNPMYDTAQGNAVTTKEPVAADKISYKIGQSGSSVVSKEAMKDTPPWSALSAYA